MMAGRTSDEKQPINRVMHATHHLPLFGLFHEQMTDLSVVMLLCPRRESTVRESTIF